MDTVVYSTGSIHEKRQLFKGKDVEDKTLAAKQVRQLKHPPREVARQEQLLDSWVDRCIRHLCCRVMEVVHLLLTLVVPVPPVDWGDVLRTMVRADFLKRARSLDLDAVLAQPRVIDCICRRQAEERRIGGESREEMERERERDATSWVLQRLWRCGDPLTWRTCANHWGKCGRHSSHGGNYDEWPSRTRYSAHGSGSDHFEPYVGEYRRCASQPPEADDRLVERNEYGGYDVIAAVENGENADPE